MPRVTTTAVLLFLAECKSIGDVILNIIFIKKMLYPIKLKITDLFVKPHYINIQKDKKIIIIDCFGITENDFSVNNENFEFVFDFKKVNNADYKRIVAFFGAPPKENLKQMSSLKLLQLSSVGTNGYEIQDIYYNNKLPIITNCSGVFSTPISEYVLGMMLLLSKYSISNYASKRLAISQQNDIQVLGSTVLILGLGDIGKKVALGCRAIGAEKIIAIKKNIDKGYEYADEIYSLENLSEVIQQADFIISTLPESKETKNIFDINLFKKMKSNAIFINVGRKTSVVEKDLIYAIKNKIISGAALDPSSDMIQTKKINRLITTGHTSYFSNQNKFRALQLFDYQIKCLYEQKFDLLKNKL